MADDQLKKSAQDDLKESRGQASKISFWNDPRTKKAIIVNRSLDPIDLITWSGKTLKDNGSARQPTGKGSVKKAASAVVITPNSFSVPPCSRVEVPVTAAVEFRGLEKNTSRVKRIYFSDFKGQDWARERDGKLRTRREILPDPGATLVLEDSYSPEFQKETRCT